MILPVALGLSAASVLVLSRRTSPPALRIEPFPHPARRAGALLLLTLTLALAAFAPLLQMPSIDPNAPVGDVAFVELFVGHGMLAFFLVAWWALSPQPRWSEFLVLGTGDPWGYVRTGLLAGLWTWVVTMAVTSVAGLGWELVTGGTIGGAGEMAPPEELPEVVRLIVGLSAPERFLLILSAGVFEEAFFRSFLQTRGGLLLSSLLFAISHASYGLPFMLVGVFTVSIVIGRLFTAQRSVVPCMVAHSVFDGIQLFVILPVVAETMA